MGNHYHILLKTFESNLSKAMQWLGTSYTRKFNITNHQSGHLFQGRFKSILVENNAYLLRLSCYIHRNPLRAGIVERLSEYNWSSYRYYAYKKRPPGWLKTNLILSQVASPDYHKSYRIKVQQYSGEEGSFWEDLKHGFILGTQAFVDDIKAKFLKGERDAELPHHNSLFKDCDINALLDFSSKLLNLDMKTARTVKRIGAAGKDKRDLLIYMLWKTGRFSNKEIGYHFGLTYSAVSHCAKIMSRRIPIEKELQDQYAMLKSQIKG